MIYFLCGPNSYQALRKIKEFKEAFFKKRGDSPVEEFDGEDAEVSVADFRSALGQGSLFPGARLIVFRNVLSAGGGETLNILGENGEFLKNSKDVFVFWEREPEKSVANFFKKHSEKIQETKPLSAGELDAWLAQKAKRLGVKLSKDERALMIEKADASAEWALENELEKIVLSGKPALSLKPGFESPKKPGFSPSAGSPFSFVEKIFSTPFGRALLALKEAEVAGQDLQRLIYPLLWKAKQKKMPDAYLRGILAESAMRRDPKNAYEILEKFIFSMHDRQAGLKF